MVAPGGPGALQGHGDLPLGLDAGQGVAALVLEGKLTANTLQSTYAAVGERYGAQVTGVDDFIQTIELLTDRRVDACPPSPSGTGT